MNDSKTLARKKSIGFLMVRINKTVVPLAKKTSKPDSISIKQSVYSFK